ncbi:Cytochrome c oxidase subunit 6 [Borealophlyctis nickersoniae]|nr:Cytochrome c oxidase subunit 6 [Borealophlyctis nickersoniae]
MGAVRPSILDPASTSLRPVSRFSRFYATSSPVDESSKNLDPSLKNYPTEEDLAKVWHLDPADAKDYETYVKLWHHHFSTCEDDFELERGLNHIFATDWVPNLEVIVEALKAARRLNSFATAVRTVEALENKCGNDKHFQQYKKELQPLLDELGVPHVKEFGKFIRMRDPAYWLD